MSCQKLWYNFDIARYFDQTNYNDIEDLLIKCISLIDELIFLHIQEASRNLVLLIASLVMTGHTQLQPSPAIATPFQLSEYSIPSPSGAQGVSIRNLDAFKVMMNVFLAVSYVLVFISNYEGRIQYFGINAVYS